VRAWIEDFDSCDANNESIVPRSAGRSRDVSLPDGDG